MDAAMHIPEDHRFGIADAKAHLSSLVTRVEQAGESFVLVRYGRPVARITPYRDEVKPERSARGILSAHADAARREQEQDAFLKAMVDKHGADLA